MCDYLKMAEGQCNVTNSQCPYVYFCTKRGIWKPLSSFPKMCRVAEQAAIPSGYYKVCFERKGNLYVEINGIVQIIPNPYKTGETVPKYVKAYQLKSGKWRIKK